MSRYFFLNYTYDFQGLFPGLFLKVKNTLKHNLEILPFLQEKRQ